jgi:hypothetical protein
VLTPAGITVSTQGRNRSIQIAASYVFGVLQRVFMQENEHGIILVDNPHGSARLDSIEEVLLRGIPPGIAGYRRCRYFDRIVCTGVTSIRSSRLISTVDIAVGALNFCLSCRDSTITRAEGLYSVLRPLLVRSPGGVESSPWGLGLKIRPTSFTEPEFFDFANDGWTRLVRLGEVRPPPWHRPKLRIV